MQCCPLKITFLTVNFSLMKGQTTTKFWQIIPEGNQHQLVWKTETCKFCQCSHLRDSCAPPPWWLLYCPRQQQRNSAEWRQNWDARQQCCHVGHRDHPVASIDDRKHTIISASRQRNDVICCSFAALFWSVAWPVTGSIKTSHHQSQLLLGSGSTSWRSNGHGTAQVKI